MSAQRRTATAIRFDADLYDELVAAAADRDVSVNWLVNKAIAYFLPRLVPADEIKLIRDAEPNAAALYGSPE